MKKNWRIILSSLFIAIGLWTSWAVAGVISTNFSQNISETLRIANLQLQLEKQRLSSVQQNFQKLKTTEQTERVYFNVTPVTAADLQKVDLSLSNTKIQLGNVEIALADANENILFTQNELLELTRASDRSHQPVQGKEAWTQLLQIQQQRLNYLNQTRDTLKQHFQELQIWRDQLSQGFSGQKQQQNEFSLVAYEEKLQINQQQLLHKLTALTNESNNSKSASSNLKIEQEKAALQFQIFCAQERLSINHLELFMSQLQKRIHASLLTLPDSNTIADLQQRQIRAEAITRKLNQMRSVVADKMTLLQSHLKLLTKSDPNFATYDSLIQKYRNEDQKINEIKGQVDHYRDQIDKMLTHRFTIRQTLPGFSISGWMSLGHKIMLMPKMVVDVAQNIIKDLWFQIKYQRSWFVYLFLLVELGLAASWWFMRKTFRKFFSWLAESSRNFLNQFLRTALILIGKNLGTIWIVIGLSLFHFILGINRTTLFLSVAVIYLFYQSLRMLLKVWLVENVNKASALEFKLYYQLRWILNVGNLVTILVVFAHYLPVDYDVKTLINKAFMALLFIVSLLLFRMRTMVPTLVQRIFALRKNYIQQMVRLVCLILPITLLTTAIMGLIGYVDLAWEIGSYQIAALVVLSAYMIIRSLIVDFMELNSELLMRNFKSGWLWTQAFIRPLERILRVLLLIVALTLLLHHCGLDHNRVFLGKLHAILSTPLINFGKNFINLNVLIGAFFYIAFLAWLTKWSKEFAFRWFFIRAKDIGLRNSLSVFTQYIAVAVALLMGLKIFGLDLKGLAVIAAAFAAGMGFALKDLASNFISGIMLLIERPFRTGDTITLGEYEGEVVSTGMRSMKIQTWDHMDVIVPNADIFTKPFMNWTLQDSIVRTVIKITADRNDDPRQIQEIIYEVLHSKSEVVDFPEPEVFMKELSDTMLEFEVRYFVDLQKVKGRSHIRSEVLLAIWDTFKKNNIQTPYTRYDVNLLARRKESKVVMES